MICQDIGGGINITSITANILIIVARLFRIFNTITIMASRQHQYHQQERLPISNTISIIINSLLIIIIIISKSSSIASSACSSSSSSPPPSSPPSESQEGTSPAYHGLRVWFPLCVVGALEGVALLHLCYFTTVALRIRMGAWGYIIV